MDYVNQWSPVGDDTYDIHDKRIDDAPTTDVTGKALVKDSDGDFYWSSFAGGGGGSGTAEDTSYVDNQGIGATDVQSALDATIQRLKLAEQAIEALQYIVENNQLISVESFTGGVLRLQDIVEE